VEKREYIEMTLDDVTAALQQYVRQRTGHDVSDVAWWEPGIAGVSLSPRAICGARVYVNGAKGSGRIEFG
jgi:hypothetical protein